MNKNVADFKIKRILFTLGIVYAYADIIKKKTLRKRSRKECQPKLMAPEDAFFEYFCI